MGAAPRSFTLEGGPAGVVAVEAGAGLGMGVLDQGDGDAGTEGEGQDGDEGEGEPVAGGGGLLGEGQSEGQEEGGGGRGIEKEASGGGGEMGEAKGEADEGKQDNDGALAAREGTEVATDRLHRRDLLEGLCRDEGPPAERCPYHSAGGRWQCTTLVLVMGYGMDLGRGCLVDEGTPDADGGRW